jgi:hypothetical protein
LTGLCLFGPVTGLHPARVGHIPQLRPNTCQVLQRWGVRLLTSPIHWCIIESIQDQSLALDQRQSVCFRGRVRCISCQIPTGGVVDCVSHATRTGNQAREPRSVAVSAGRGGSGEILEPTVESGWEKVVGAGRDTE